MSYSPTIIPCATEAEWHEQRSKLIGASEVAALFGLSPFETPRQLWLRKCGAGAPPKEETEAMTAGKFLEEGNARWYAHVHGDRLVVTPQEFYDCRGAFAVIVRHPDLPIQCTPDRMVARDLDFNPNPHGVLQLKNSSAFSDGWDEDAPLYYQMQVQAELLCTGLTWGALGAVIGGNKRRDFDLERHEGFLALLAEKVSRFFNEPAPEPQAGDLEAIKAIYPTAKEGSIFEYPRPEELMELAAVRARRSEDEKIEKALAAKILETIGTAETLTIGGVKVGTCKSSKREGYIVAPTTARSIRIDSLVKKAKANALPV